MTVGTHDTDEAAINEIRLPAAAVGVYDENLVFICPCRDNKLGYPTVGFHECRRYHDKRCTGECKDAHSSREFDIVANLSHRCYNRSEIFQDKSTVPPKLFPRVPFYLSDLDDKYFHTSTLYSN